MRDNTVTNLKQGSLLTACNNVQYFFLAIYFRSTNILIVIVIIIIMVPPIRLYTLMFLKNPRDKVQLFTLLTSSILY